MSLSTPAALTQSSNGSSPDVISQITDGLTDSLQPDIVELPHSEITYPDISGLPDGVRGVCAE